MFTSLFQLEQKPVTVFSSDDTGAPILTKDAGSLKTLLEACLVTGYGDKTSLGWQMLFESSDTLSAAFASNDPTASKYVLKVDNSTATSAKISAYQSMTDIDTGVKPLAVDNEYELFSCAWRLIGHSKAFVLVLDATKRGGISVANPILFGDLPHQSQRVTAVPIFWTAKETQYYQGGLQVIFDYTPNGSGGSTSNTTNTSGAAYPVVTAGLSDSYNIKTACSKFNSKTLLLAPAMYDPYIIALPDNTWTILSAIQPLSTNVGSVGNLMTLNETAIKVRLSNLDSGVFNVDCAIPTDWWWA